MSRAFPVSLCALTLFTTTAIANALAHHTDSSLLRLVPDDAQIISGISDPGIPFSSGRLLFVTENNNRDFDDCLAMLGVDQNKVIDEVIQADASSSRGDLTDHMLLLGGRFDEKRIFQAAFKNGAAMVTYNGQDLIVIKPFQREDHLMRDVRWMAILNNHFLVFGVPRMVADALNRYQTKATTSPAAIERLGRLPSDDDSWTIIAMPPSTLAAHLDPIMMACVGAQLKGVDEVELGIHYARTARIDFSIHTDSGASTTVRSILVGVTRKTSSRFRIEGNDRVSGSILVSEKEFDERLAILQQSIMQSR